MNLLNVLTSIILGGTATSYVTEFLKLSFIKLPAEKYPRSTAAVFSVISAVIALLVNGVNFSWTSVAATLPIAVSTFVISTFVYNQALSGLKSNSKS
jgi:hypothetical protein